VAFVKMPGMGLVICLGMLSWSLMDTEASAAIHPPKRLFQGNSRCEVESTEGEQPVYQVLRAGKIIFAPQSRGIFKALISSDGKHVALFASESESLIDVEPGKFKYGAVAVHCDSGRVRGYRRGQPTLVDKWDRFTEILKASGEKLP
jgi:hypothetical protein